MSKALEVILELAMVECRIKPVALSSLARWGTRSIRGIGPRGQCCGKAEPKSQKVAINGVWYYKWPYIFDLAIETW